MRPSILTDNFTVWKVALPPRGRMPPPECYTDREFYELEKQALFNHEWLCVGRESDIPNAGDFFTTHCDEPIIVVRNKSGEIKALASLLDRVMLVAEAATSGVRCPYHHWTYSLDGDLEGASDEATCNFSEADYGLPSFQVELWLGFIFINFDPKAPALSPRLTAVEETIANYDLASASSIPPETLNFSCNWKVQFENNNDGYHANRLHQGKNHDFCPSHLCSFPKMPPDTAGYTRVMV